jgi:hypothetical protein
MSKELRELVKDLRTSRHYGEGFDVLSEKHSVAERIEEILAIHGEMEMI